MFFKFKSKELTKEDYKKMSDSKIGRLMSTDIKAKYEYIRRNFENLKDRNQVLDMLNEVVANEITDGYYYLGKIYYYEQFGEPDYDKAMSYFKQGVEKGDKDCYFQVAYIAYVYLQDNDTALLYAKEGYANGDKECRKIIIPIYEENNDSAYKKDLREKYLKRYIAYSLLSGKKIDDIKKNKQSEISDLDIKEGIKLYNEFCNELKTFNNYR